MAALQESEGVGGGVSVDGEEVNTLPYARYAKIMKDVVVLKEIGRGMYGRVSLVKYRGNTACMKVANGKESKTHLQQFKKEAEVMWKLAGTGGAPRLYAVGRDKPIIVMEYCEGVTLWDFSRPRHNPDKTLIKTLLLDVACQLRDVHEKGYFHNDIHSHNILVCKIPDGFTTKIIDYGLASKTSEIGANGNKVTGFTDVLNTLKLIAYTTDDSTKDGAMYCLNKAFWVFN